jgi:hypothetical protein
MYTAKYFIINILYKYIKILISLDCVTKKKKDESRHERN